MYFYLLKLNQHYMFLFACVFLKIYKEMYVYYYLFQQQGLLINFALRHSAYFCGSKLNI